MSAYKCRSCEIYEKPLPQYVGGKLPLSQTILDLGLAIVEALVRPQGELQTLTVLLDSEQKTSYIEQRDIEFLVKENIDGKEVYRNLYLHWDIDGIFSGYRTMLGSSVEYRLIDDKSIMDKIEKLKNSPRVNYTFYLYP